MASKIFKILQPVRKYSISNIKNKISPYHEKLLAAPQTKISAIENGLRVATENTGKQTATVGFWLDNGIRYESEENNGVSKFMEHLFFAGTKKKESTKLELELEKMGVQLKSETGKEHQALFANCLAKDVPKVVEILSDIIQTITYDDKEFERARSDILKEIDDMESNPRQIVMDYLHTFAYQKTSLALPNSGSTGNIKAMKKEDVQNFARDTLLSTRTILASSGGVSHDDMVSLANKHLGTMNNTYVGEIPHELTPCRYTGGEIRDRDDYIDYPHYLLAIEGTGWDHEDHLPLEIGRSIMGNWDFSYGGANNISNQFPAYCNEDGMNIKKVESVYFPYKGTGLWGTYIVSEMLRQEEIIFQLQYEWLRMGKSIFDTEVEQAKNYIRHAHLAPLRTTEGSFKDIGNQILRHNERLTPSDFEEELSEVTPEEVQNALYDHIYDKCPVVIGYGPTQALTDYCRVRVNMYQMRT